MKKRFFGVFLVFSLFVVQVFSLTIGVTQIVEHPALDAVFEGLKEELSDMDLVYDHQIAQGSFQNATQIAKKFNNDSDLIVAIATPSAQAAANSIKNKPIVFTAVTDPVAAGLIPKMGLNSGNIVGISDMLPVELHMNLIKKYFPEAKNIGLLFNTGEINSKKIVELANKYSEELGLNTIEISGSNINELITGINSRSDEVDIFYLFTDNLVASSIELLSEKMKEKKIPVISGDIDIAKASSVIGFGFDYKSLGIETGKIVRRIINGEKISEIESTFMPGNALLLYLNLERAKAFNLNIPDELIDNADIIE
ncbi:ABC transporter substrate-binding protein [Geotoga petraea]|jgi:putative ABC transport system substrate-binding protein|uniref:Putative ABC transport system substrate-binding protein n=1 Tax=Geotoga petraea TaxID=28234 RepID=A0A1G6IRG4_9BACT|nr:ABC transporter substrate-binding protein [Geotoga petraea]MDK2945712.1 putative tryptophan/tyrosine transport system substrate-binding protein [Geotoga sp.]SDC09074.1 putative ABC transport system substrate-binding protein [Geotoga petraea]